MLWAHVRTHRAYRTLSSVLTLMLVLSLANPGVAVFAAETSSTPEPLPPAEVVEPPADPGLESPPEPQPVEDPEEVAPDGEPVVVEAEEAPPVVEPAPEPEVPAPSQEVLPVTVVAVPLVANGQGPRDDFPPPVVIGEGCDLTTIATFWAGQNYDAGTVSVYNDATTLYVTFTTTGGWTMGLTHLYVGLVPPASYSPGSFPYQTAHDPAVTSFTYEIDLESLGAGPGDTVYVAAHAEVSNGEQSETAWAGQGQWPGLLFSHEIPECEPLPADITVVKFHDLDEDGVFDEGEPLLEDVEITIEGSEYSDSALTDESGEVVFGPLDAGDYTVDEVVPEGWFPTVELPIEVALVEGQDQTVYIGNAEEPVEPLPADITVVKFHDLDEDGVFDEGEPLLEDVEITIEGSEYSDSALTDESGEVVFGPLDAGDYTVDEVVPEGWFPTVELPIEVALVEGQDQTVYIGNAEEPLPFTDIDLAIEKQADVATASAGDLITYTLTYRNVGTTDAAGYTITDDFDETLVEVVDAGGGTVMGGTLVWYFADPLSPEDGAQTLTYTVRVLNPVPAGETVIFNVVVISHPDDDNPANDTDDESVAIEPFLPFTPTPKPAAPVSGQDPYLPFTGGEAWLLGAIAAAGLFVGLTLRRFARLS